MRSATLYKKHQLLPDKKFNSLLISKMINLFMLKGKKSICESKIVYPALQLLEDYYFKHFKDIKITDDNYMEKILTKALNNIAFHYVIKKYKFGGAVFKIPIEKKIDLNNPLNYNQIKALRILSKILRNRGKKYREINNTSFKGEKSYQKLFKELSNALHKKGEVFKISKKNLQTAIANKAFSHLLKNKNKKK